MANFIPAEQKMMTQLRELIENNFKEQRIPGFYCDTLGITLRRLNRLTYFYFKRTLHQLLQDRIHQEAKVLLSQTMMPVKEICYALGVCDPSHFTKTFKHFRGMTPREFRKGIMARIDQLQAKE